jgi:beta-N-acetylhexosaminidase
MLDIQGTVLDPEDVDLLQNPMVGGLILFTRNYASAQQVTELVQAIREAAAGDILLAVDHEGGRVQRFRPEFTRLPPVAALGSQYGDDPLEARRLARLAGWLMAAEVRAVGVDFSFAPVLDLDFGVSRVIGDRSFNRQPEVVTDLAGAYIGGMRAAGMASTGKHFPGHGFVEADSHLDIPRDSRSLTAIMQEDVLPFRQLMEQGLDAVMPAHVIYGQVDSRPAGFSPVWLQEILRGELGFNGVIFSDDLSMEGASVAGGYAARAEAALVAGCDMILACNNRAGAKEILDKADLNVPEASSQRLERMRGQPFMNRSALLEDGYWRMAVESVTALA